MYEVSYFERQERKKRSFVQVISFLFLAVLIVLSGLTFLKTYNKSATTDTFFLSPLAAEIIHETVSFINSRQNSKDIEKIVSDILQKDTDKYAVVIENLKNGERYYLNKDKIFETASLYKLWVMAVSYEDIERGKLSETDVLGASIESLNKKFNISSESAELTEGTISLPVQNALEKMITISDNYTAMALTERIGLSTVAKFLSNNGFIDSKVGSLSNNPSASASDIAKFFKGLYSGELANPILTDKMLTLLKSQKVNTKLSKNLPANAIIAHKTGELGKYSHDGGIVYTQNGDYIIVVMSETAAPQVANEKISDISRQVYDYFVN